VSTSIEIAARIENKAKEIAAAMNVYPRLPRMRHTLAMSADLMLGELNQLWGEMLRQLEQETVNAEEK
jgi:hypothetical protein